MNFSKKEKPSLGIMDAKSIKNTNTVEEKEYDNHKKISGIKLHMIVDTLGLPHALFVSKASMTDRKGVISMMECQKESLCLMETFLVDGGYMGGNFCKRSTNPSSTCKSGSGETR